MDYRDFIVQVIKNRNRNRLWITIITLFVFMGIVIGLGYALVMEATVTSAWKEILLILIGAFIGSYGKVMDYWFSDTEKDMALIDHIAETSVRNVDDTEVYKERNNCDECD